MSELALTQAEWEGYLREAEEVDLMGLSSLFDDDEETFLPADASESVVWESLPDADDDDDAVVPEAAVFAAEPPSLENVYTMAREANEAERP